MVRLGQTPTASGATVAGSTVITSGEQALTGTVIRFTDPECRK